MAPWEAALSRLAYAQHVVSEALSQLRVAMGASAVLLDDVSDAIGHSWAALVGWTRVLSTFLRVLLPLIWELGCALQPYLVRGAKHVWDHQRRQPWPVLLAEFFLVAGVVVLFLLQRHVRKQRYVERARHFVRRKSEQVARRYRRFMSAVEKANKRAAMALPHAVFAAISLIAMSVSYGRLAEMGDSGAASFLMLLFPAAATILCIIEGSELQMRSWLRYWSVWAVASAAEGAVVHLPYIGATVSTLSLLPVAKLLFYAWILLPIGGADLAYRYFAVPLTARYVATVPPERTAGGDDAAAGGLLSQVLAMVRPLVFRGGSGGWMSKAFDTFGQALREAPFLLASLPFLVMPGMLTRYGTIYIALLYPTHFTMAVPLARSVSAAGADEDALRACRYWTVAALAMFCKEAGVDEIMAWVPFSTKMELLFFLYLQLPGVRGADALFDRIVRALSFLLPQGDGEGGEGGEGSEGSEGGPAAGQGGPAEEEEGSDGAREEKAAKRTPKAGRRGAGADAKPEGLLRRGGAQGADS